MTLLFAVIVFVVLFLCFLLYQVARHFLFSKGTKESPTLTEIDIEAFRNLVDPAENAYLRRQLPPREYTQIYRLRLHAASAYVSALSGNAATMLTVGQAVRSNPDPEIAASGQRLFNRALELRVSCLLVGWKLQIMEIWPHLFAPSGRIADRYIDVASLVAALPKQVA